MAVSQFSCSNCGQIFSAEPDVSGVVSCPFCNAQFIVQTALDKTHVTVETPAVDSMPCEKDALPPGTDVNGFEIIRLIGLGGMGSVYLATQKSMQREVALKLLNPNVTRNAESVKQFLAEVRNSGKLQHPNIVSAYDAGEYNGNYYLAMQYVKGDTLDSIIEKNGPLPELRALEIILQIATALDYVWSKFKMFHRDIKPGNFMLNEDSTAMLMDMGIAQGLGEWNPDGAIEGSPYYMSPEQIRGEQLSWTTDQYSLGVSLFQIVSGRMPFDADSIEEILNQHCTAQVPKISQFAPGIHVSTATQTLIEKMMEKKPEQRFDSWQSVMKQISSIISSMTSKKPKLSLHTKTSSNIRKAAEEKPSVKEKPAEVHTPFNWKKIGIPAVFALVIAALAGGTFWFRGKINNSVKTEIEKTNREIAGLAEDTDRADAVKSALAETEKSAALSFLLSPESKKNLEKVQKDAADGLKAAEEKKKTFEKNLAAVNDGVNRVRTDCEKDRSAKKLDLKKVRDYLGKTAAQTKQLSALTPPAKSGTVKINAVRTNISKLETMLRADEKNFAAAEKAKTAKAAPAKKQVKPQPQKAVKPQSKKVVKPQPPRKNPPPKKPAQPSVNVARAAGNFRNTVVQKAVDSFLSHKYGVLKAVKVPPELAKAKPAPKDLKVYEGAMDVYKNLQKCNASAERFWNLMLKNPGAVTLPAAESQVIVYLNGIKASLMFREFRNGKVIFSNKKETSFSDLSGEAKYKLALAFRRKMNVSVNDFNGFLVAEFVPPTYLSAVQRREIMPAFNDCFRCLKQRASRDKNLKKRLRGDFGKTYDKLGN